MTNHTRRTFLREASRGLAATTGGALLLRADAFPTRSTIYFHGDPHQKEDGIFHPSLSVPAQKRTANGQSLETATFDIVLERA